MPSTKKDGTVNNSIDSVSVNDLLEMISAPEPGQNKGKCILMRKIELMPQNVQDALAVALDNVNVGSREIAAFINANTDQHVNLTNVQTHRAKKGCLVCLFGGSL